MEALNKRQGQSTRPLQASSKDAELTQEHQEALLVEYEIAHHHAWKWDNATWQSAAIFVPASLAGFILIAQIPDSSRFKPFLVCTVALCMILALLGWLGLIHRWESYKKGIYYRLREIEQELGLWKNRYLEFLLIRKIPDDRWLVVTSEEEKTKLQQLEQVVGKFSVIKPVLLIQFTAIGLISGWLSVLAYEIIPVFIH